MARILKLTTPNEIQVETAKLRLALLKENFEFRKTFRDHEGDASTLFMKLCERFELNPFFYKPTVDPVDREIPQDNIFALFDPKISYEQIPAVLVNLLPWLFYRGGVRHVDLNIYELDANCLQPYERVLVIDLRLKESELVRQFKAYLQYEYEYRKSLLRHPSLLRYNEFSHYQEWDVEISRFRQETKEQLEVWNLRKQQMAFGDIARRLSIHIDTAKKQFYAAFEKTQGRPYDPDFYREKRKELRLAEALTCNTCKERDTCTDPCPTVAEIVSDEERPLKELLPDSPIRD